MLKIIGIITALVSPLVTQAGFYELVISDYSTDQVQVEEVYSEIELRRITDYLLDLEDDTIQFKVRKINFNSTDAIKRDGGEGGTD